jgi:alkanesulfonate monooxygenase SsuD/methylene tetrahydromethanopterin reductase-like flavin-dependent oxidoreductase (luciferase family)
MPRENRGRHVALIEQGLGMVKGTFDSAWFVDHLQFDDRDVLEGWTAITYMAARHPEFQFGNAVLCQSFRNPGLVAKMGATLQFMSGGRFILGLGAGWKEDEYEAYGYDFPGAGARVEQLDEYVQIIKALWTEERATFEGKHYRVKDAYCEPKPQPMPTIMIGAHKAKMLELTAREADWWNVSWTPLDEYKVMVKECERACVKAGRDPATLRRTWFGGCMCAPNEAELKKLLGERPPQHGAIAGTTQQVIEQMQGFVEMGVDYFMLGTPGLPNFVTLETLLGEVVPAVRTA